MSHRRKGRICLVFAMRTRGRRVLQGAGPERREALVRVAAKQHQIRLWHAGHGALVNLWIAHHPIQAALGICKEPVRRNLIEHYDASQSHESSPWRKNERAARRRTISFEF